MGDAATHRSFIAAHIVHLAKRDFKQVKTYSRP